MSAIMDATIRALPWAAVAVILVEFALVDELPAARVRRVSIGAGVVLLLASALAMWWTPTPALLRRAGGAMEARVR